MKPWLLVAALVVVTISGCGPDDPKTGEFNLDETLALGPTDTTVVPAEAKLMDAIEFSDHYLAGDLRVTADRNMIEIVEGATTGDHAIDLAAALVTAEAASDERFVEQTLKLKRPSFYKMFSSTPRALPMRQRATSKLRTRSGVEIETPVLSLEAKVTRLASALRVFPTLENQRAVYELLYTSAPESARAGFPLPTDIGTKTAEELAALNDQLAAAAVAATGNGNKSPRNDEVAAITGVDADCSADEGNGSLNSDRLSYTSYYYCTHTARGVYSTYAYPMRSYATCVKNQANRGTCGAFAIVAAVETQVALDMGVHVNLSEQDIYSHVKNNWWPSFYGDGVNPHGVWQKMVSANYVMPFESLWDYNPSNSRYSNAADTAYINSCKNYFGAECSNTVHQAGLYCTNHEGFLYCGFLSPVNEGGHGYRVTSETEIWNNGNLDGTITAMRAALDGLHPVLLSSEVPPTFDNPDANGYAGYTADAESSRGGHVYELLGYVTNEQLAVSSPLAPAGAGGGYFIAKNSWSQCFSDGGYIYLPFSWAKKNAWSATVLKGLVQH